MIEKKLIKKKIEILEVSSIKCDLCKKSILKDKTVDDVVGYASLLFTKAAIFELKEGNVSDETELRKEASDFCEKCYNIIIQHIRMIGAKVPSYFFDAEAAQDLIEEMIENDGKH